MRVLSVVGHHTLTTHIELVVISGAWVGVKVWEHTCLYILTIILMIVTYIVTDGG